jgi:hypothetical protein
MSLIETLILAYCMKLWLYHNDEDDIGRRIKIKIAILL